MGVFFYELILPSRGREQSQQMMAGLSPELVRQCHLNPVQYRWSDHNRGTSLLLNDSASPFDALAQAASKALDGTAMLCYIYDDDFWGYELYHKGDFQDIFWTVPGYFGEPDPRLTLHTPEQRAGLLAQYLSVDPNQLLPYLSPWPDTAQDEDFPPACPGDRSTPGDCWQLADFLRRLGYWSEEPDKEEPEPPTASKAGGGEDAPAVRPVAEKPFSMREPVLFHDPDVSRCIPYLKAVRRLAVPKRRLFGLLPPKPSQVEAVPLQGLDGAALQALLEQYFLGKLEQLELDMELPGKGIFVKRLKKMVSQPIHFTVELFQENGRFLCVCFDDEDQYLYWLIADKNAYYHEDCKAHSMTALAGRNVEAYLVHTGPAVLRQEVVLMLSNLDRKDEVFNCLGRMAVWSNEWHYRNKKKHQELRTYWCFPPT